ncbi:hypothetical protein AMTRI_Chr11g153560 [Amborella trichopoda]
MIERLQRNFLWASEVEKKGVHLVKWKTLCLPMAEEGLEVKDTVDFNIAGMMKLAWKILENPSSLLELFFKHRYFRNSSIWEVEGRRVCSHAWKGILLGLFHLRGMYSGILVMSLSNFHDDNIEEYLGTVVGSRVSNFIIRAPQAWVLPHPTSTFLRNIWREMENYTLPIQPKKDSLAWIHSTDGSFSIKKAWDFIRHQGSSQLIFRALWSSKCYPRVKWFS